MSKNEVIVLAFFSPVVIVVVMLPPALAVLFFQKVVPVLWRRYPRWWWCLPGVSASRRARALRSRVEREQTRESLPGGLFGTYWKQGTHGLHEARRTAMVRWHRMETEAEKLEGDHR